MRNDLKKIKNLPLTFKYLDFEKISDKKTSVKGIIYTIGIEAYQTEYGIRGKPEKSLTRLK